MKTFKVSSIVILFISISNLDCIAQTQDHRNIQLMQIRQEMENFYNLMRQIDLDWMEYLTENSTAVHNGEFLSHDKFIRAEKDFFNSLSFLEIEVISKPVIYLLGTEGASVTQEHVINLQTRTGRKSEDVHQMMTFIWKKVHGKWKIAQAVFTTKSQN